MASETKVTTVAADPKAGMTLRELSEFVTACFKSYPSVDADRPVKITIGWRSQVQSISTT